MTKQKDSTERDRAAEKELDEWRIKWAGTPIVDRVFAAVSPAKRKRRGHPGKPDPAVLGVLLTVVGLEKCGMSLAAAKKEAANRHCLNLRSVQGYYNKSIARGRGREYAEMAISSAATDGRWRWIAHSGRLRDEEIRKLKERNCFREN
jgi:hypothetical protein